MKSNGEFLRGVKAGLPICFGYLSVSFGFGILAVQSGIPAWVAVIISLTNVTSAGQVAGVEIIAQAGSFIEMILTQLLINARYSLMAFALSQKCGDFPRRKRFLAAFGITDEIFATNINEKKVEPEFMFGVIVPSVAGWVLGTLLGAVMGDVLPSNITEALGILLYGMFIAIIIPPVRRSAKYLVAVAVAAVVSCVIYYLIPGISSGFSIIISSVAATAVTAAIYPVDAEEDLENEAKEEN